MSLSLKESNAISNISEILAAFLPYSGAYENRGQITYRSIAHKLGIGGFWEKRSKQPGIAVLLERILQERSDLCEQFILHAVREGIRRRQKDGQPITREEIENLNGHILEIGFKFPDLWDPEFLAALELPSEQRAKINVERIKNQERLRTHDTTQKDALLSNLKDNFYTLHNQDDRQSAGLELEKILNKLFHLYSLLPRGPFKIIGEQIDGSFVLDNEVYLVEAKWQKEKVQENDLIVFMGKISGKSTITRGAFVTISGTTDGALDAITRGKQPNFIVIDGYDISLVLEGYVDLVYLLREKVRRLAEEGRIFVSAKEIGCQTNT